jgi:flagellar motor switch protein FliN/FliY
MSDGSLSQDEIDALLSGIDPTGGAPGAGAGGPALSEGEKKAFIDLLSDSLETQGQNLLTITGQATTFQRPSLDVVNRDGLIQSIPEEVLAIDSEMSGGIPGAHIYILTKEFALSLAALANKEESLSDLDDMAISAVQEAISTLAGTEVTLFAEKSGNKSIQSQPAAGQFVPKAMVKLPEGDFARVTYSVQMGDSAPEKLIEIFSLNFVKDLVLATGGGQPSMGFDQASQAAGMGMGMGQAGQQMPPPGFGQMQQQMPQMGGMAQGYPQQMQPQMAMQGFGGMPQMGYQQPFQQGQGMNPPNVQSVQFPNFQTQAPGQESGNIGLIMDVYMEMTVELGRTKKLIKEILGMGEGTIIELDKLAGEPVDILVNHKKIAQGEVVVIDENFGVRVVGIVSPNERIADIT